MKKILILIIVAAIWGCSDEEKSSDPSYLPGKEYMYNGFGLPANREEWKDYGTFSKMVESDIKHLSYLKLDDYYTVSLGDSGKARQGSHVTNLEYDFVLSFDKHSCSIHYFFNIERETSYFHGIYKYYKFREARIIKEVTNIPHNHLEPVTRNQAYVIQKDGIYLIDFVGTNDSTVTSIFLNFTGDYEFRYLVNGKEVLGEEVQQIDSLETFTYRLVQDSILMLENSQKKIEGVFRNNYKDLHLKIDMEIDSGFGDIGVSEVSFERK